MSPTLKATLIIPSLDGGGAERILLWLGDRLAARGYRVTVLTLDPDTPDVYAVPTGVIRERAAAAAFASHRWFDAIGQERRRKALRKSILTTEPDIVLSFIDTTNIAVLSALRDCDIPVVVSERTDWRNYSIGWRWNLLRRLHYPRAASVVSVARAPAEEATNYWPRWNVCHIPNAISIPGGYDEPRPAWFGHRNLIAMGRLVEVKGFDLLLPAFAATAKARPDWHLTILGAGPLERELEQLSERLSIADRVTFAGVINPPHGILKQADLFIFSSRLEGFPNALGEAMGCGLPVISFDCPSGPADIVRHEVDGLLIPPEDVEALSVAMGGLMDDEGRRRKMASQAKQITERFPEDRIMDLWEDVVLSALRGRQAA